jgi:hypothetical protein
VSRLDQYAVSVSIDGTSLGVFDKMSGGEIDSEETKYKQGGMVPPVTLGGSISVGNVTVQRLFRLDRDKQQESFLKSRVGKGSVTVSKQSLDVDGNPYGSPTVYRGTYKQLTFPEPDSESSAAALLQIEVSSATVV